MDRNLNEAQKHAIQYWMVDGLAEIGLGILCFLLAGGFFILEATPETRWGNMVFVLIGFAYVLGMRWAIQRTKERDTYPRTGFVEYKSGLENKTAVIIAVVITLFILLVQIIFFLKDIKGIAWSIGVSGIILVFVFGWVGYYSNIPRFIFLACFCLVVSVFLALMGPGVNLGNAILCLLVGFWLEISGIRTRYNYLQSSPRPPEEENGR